MPQPAKPGCAMFSGEIKKYFVEQKKKDKNNMEAVVYRPVRIDSELDSVFRFREHSSSRFEKKPSGTQGCLAAGIRGRPNIHLLFIFSRVGLSTPKMLIDCLYCQISLCSHWTLSDRCCEFCYHRVESDRPPVPVPILSSGVNPIEICPVIVRSG